MCPALKENPGRQIGYWKGNLGWMHSTLERFKDVAKVRMICGIWGSWDGVEIYAPTYVSPNMHMTCLLLAQDTQVKIVCVSDLLVIIVQSGSGALAPVTGFLGK